MREWLQDMPGLDEALLELDEAVRRGAPTQEILARTQGATGELAGRVVKAERCLLLLDAMRRDSNAEDLSASIAAPADERQTPASPRVERLGRFVIERELGYGATGVVVLAFDPALRRRIALKLPSVGTLSNPELRRRFLQEGEAAARLRHPHILTVFEAGEFGAISYIAQEYCGEGNLADWLGQEANRLSVRQAALLVMLLARAIHHAHSRGVLHRDLKPANILLLPAPEADADSSNGDPSLPFVPKVGDFGLAKVLAIDTQDTRTGVVIGTPQYMAPEQARGDHHEIGTHTDVYALGVILYQLITRRLPYTGVSDAVILQQVASVEPVSLEALEYQAPRDLVSVCQKCLEKEPAARYSSAAALADDLRRFLAGQPTWAHPLPWPRRVWRWSRRRPAATALVVVCLAAAASLVGGAIFHVFQMESALELAHRAQRKAERLQGLSQEQYQQLQRRIFTQDLRLAMESWENAHVGQARQLLARHAPAAGREDLRNFVWHYFDRLCRSDHRTVDPGGGPLYCATFSPQGALLATAGEDGMVRFWSVATGEAAGQLQAHRIDANCVAFAPDGLLFATASDDFTVKVWNANSRILRHELHGHSGRVIHAAFSPDGRLLATCGEDGTARLWEAATGTPLRTLRGHGDSVECVAFSHHRPLIVTAARDQTVRVWNLQAEEPPKVLQMPGLVSNCVQFDPADDRIIAIGQGDLSIALCNWETEEVRRRLEGHGSRVRCFSYSPDGQYLASLDGQIIRVWSLETGRLINQLRGHASRIWSLEWSRDGQLLASASADGTAKIWKPLEIQGAPRELGPEHNPVVAVLFSASGTRLAYLGGRGDVRIWDCARRESVATWNVDRLVTCGAWLADDRILACGTERGELVLCDAVNPISPRVIPAHSGRITCMKVSPDGALLATAGSDRLIHIWDVKQRQILGTLKENQREVKSLAFSPDARLLISVDRDRGVYAWNVARGTLLKRAMAHSGPVNCCAFAPDGQTYVTAGDDGAMAVWDANALRCTRSLPLQSTPIKSLAVGPLVSATCAADGAIRFWDNESLVNLLELKPDNVRYVCHDVSPDGRRLAAVGQLSSGGWVVHVWCPADP